MVIYDALKKCIYEGEIKQSRPEFEGLRNRIGELTDGYGERLIFYWRQLESIQFNWNEQLCILSIEPLRSKTAL